MRGFLYMLVGVALMVGGLLDKVHMRGVDHDWALPALGLFVFVMGILRLYFGRKYGENSKRDNDVAEEEAGEDDESE
jgi:ABC-type dipeptide/oligopeptide/nickel transport system permease subunit